MQRRWLKSALDARLALMLPRIGRRGVFAGSRLHRIAALAGLRPRCASALAVYPRLDGSLTCRRALRCPGESLHLAARGIAANGPLRRLSYVPHRIPEWL